MADQPSKNIKMHLDESHMSTTYANGFRHHANKHEVILDLGVSMGAKDQETGETLMKFSVDNRLIMNYVTTKRLAGMLVQIVQAHEKQFGEIKMD